MTSLLLFLGLAGAAEPSDQTLVYFNARMALREGRPDEAIRLWMLRNAIEDQTGRVSTHDADFGSLTWAALGELGVCQDGHPRDTDGVGLWPIAVHNWVVRNMSRRGRGAPGRPFDAFEVDRQRRFVSINDVLNSQELETLRLVRGGCTTPRVVLTQAGELPNAKLSDRAVAARLLRDLLERARSSLDGQRVVGRAAIEARLFDLDLQLTELAAREARRQETEWARLARQVGLGPESVEAVRDSAPDSTLPPDSEAARILEASVYWPVWEWMSMSPERRLFLFGYARRHGGDADALDDIALGIVDRLIAEGEGEEVERWIAQVGEPGDPASQAGIWSGERGARLLVLDREQGFRERSAVALQRGVDQLGAGDLPAALGSLAFALQHAEESREAERIQSLTLRWLSYVASQFEITEELLVTLQELVPRREYGILLEDLMWSAGLRADATSYERGLGAQRGRDALSRRLTLLAPLATGDVVGFDRGIGAGLEAATTETLGFIDELVQRLELEDEEVRAAHIGTLQALNVHLASVAASSDRGRQVRTAVELQERTRAILEGLGVPPGGSARDRARALDPSGEVFVGSIRLAPSDPLPWPFKASEPPAPSVFEPLDLTPVEWSDGDELVFGWSIGG